MSRSSSVQLAPLQQTILDIVQKYPDKFTRSGLSKLLVGAKSWRDKQHPGYRLYPGIGRKEMDYQIEILVQQSFLAFDGQRHLIPTCRILANNRAKKNLSCFRRF